MFNETTISRLYIVCPNQDECIFLCKLLVKCQVSNLMKNDRHLDVYELMKREKWYYQINFVLCLQWCWPPALHQLQQSYRRNANRIKLKIFSLKIQIWRWISHQNSILTRCNERIGFEITNKFLHQLGIL